MYITGLPAIDSANSTVAKNNAVLDKDAFLKLLATQLQYQDPSSPQSNDEFMGQMTNFAILEQLQQINESISHLFDAEKQFQTVQMLGREVAVVDNDGNEVQGVVESLNFSSEGPKLKVNGTEYLLSQVQELKITENESE